MALLRNPPGYPRSHEFFCYPPVDESTALQIFLENEKQTPIFPKEITAKYVGPGVGGGMGCFVTAPWMARSKAGARDGP